MNVPFEKIWRQKKREFFFCRFLQKSKKGIFDEDCAY